MRAVALKYYLSHSLPSRDAPQRLWRGPRVFTLSHREKGENCHRPHRWAWSNAPHWSTGASTCMLYYTFCLYFSLVFPHVWGWEMRTSFEIHINTIHGNCNAASGSTVWNITSVVHFKKYYEPDLFLVNHKHTVRPVKINCWVKCSYESILFSESKPHRIPEWMFLVKETHTPYCVL